MGCSSPNRAEKRVEGSVFMPGLCGGNAVRVQRIIMASSIEIPDGQSMDISDLQTFRTVVDHGGVSAAARHLHRVQSSISARITGLERNLGLALFERSGK